MKINSFFLGGGVIPDLSIGYIFKDVPAYDDSHLCPVLSTIFYFHVRVWISQIWNYLIVPNTRRNQKITEWWWLPIKGKMLICVSMQFFSFHKIKRTPPNFKSNWFCLFIHVRSGVHKDLLCYLFSDQNLENNFNKNFQYPE